MKVAIAYAPAHITGFFAIHDEPEDLIKKGSRGAGFSLNAGSTTTVTLYEKENTKEGKIEILINKHYSDAPVTRRLIELMIPKELIENVYLKIEHRLDFPVGAGFGMSAAGVLSAALALNTVFDLKYSFIKVAQFAHKAEVLERTGLGDVIAECYGKVEIRKKPGGPGFGELDFIPTSEDLSVLTFSFGGIPTSQILMNAKSRMKINEIGDKLVDELIDEPTLDKFIELSKKFTNYTSLVTVEIRRALKLVEENRWMGSMIMIGNSFFILSREENIYRMKKIIEKTLNPMFISINKISNEGAKLLRYYEQ